MKNKYTFWLILLAVLSSRFAFSQTNPTNMVGAWQQKDTVGGKVVQFRNSSTSLGVTKIVTPATLSDSLKNYAQIQDGLISGGTPTTNGDSLIVASGVVRINGINYNFTGRTFADIAPSSVGLTRILIVYANTSGLLDSISGAESNNPVEPTLPINTQRVVTVSVSDAGLGVPTVDLSGKADLVGGNNFIGNQIINGNTNIVGNLRINAVADTSIAFTNISWNKIIGTGASTFDNERDIGDVGFIFRSKNNTSSFKELMRLNADSTVNIYGNYLINGGKINASHVDTTSIGLQPKLGYTPYNPSSYPVNLGGENLQSISTRGNVTNTTLSSSDGVVSSIISYNGAPNRSGVVGTSTNHDLLVFTNTNEVARFKTNGNFGIGIDPTSTLHVNGLARATGFGAGIAPSANHYLTTAANTSTIGSLLWTPSSTDYTGTVSGTFYNNANELKFYDGTISGTNRLLKLFGNSSFVGTGQRVVTTNSVGDAAATTPIIEQFNTDSDVITAITAATYNKANTFTATITPASSKTFYKGQLYKSSTYLYVATADNVSYRVPLYSDESGWASYVDNQYTSGSPLSISSGTTVTLTNNAATVINSNLPVGVTAFYNSSTSKITPASLGDSYSIAIRFKAQSSSASDYFDFGIDIGGSVGVIFKQTKSFLKGANTEMSFDIETSAYALSTFLANGGLVKLTAGNGTMTVYDIVFDIFRTHKGY